jgi:hypothetical protein
MGREIRISMACIGERVARYMRRQRVSMQNYTLLPLPRRK